MHKMFQKLATFVLIITMMGAPLASAFGQSFSCDMQLDSTTIQYTVKNTINADHNCCEKPEKTHCSHCDECDCDNAQINLNAIHVDTVEFALTPATQFATTFYTIQVTKLLSSLYRPPRKFL